MLMWAISFLRRLCEVFTLIDFFFFLKNNRMEFMKKEILITIARERKDTESGGTFGYTCVSYE